MSVRLFTVKEFEHSKSVPYIYISGQWLADAGFEIGKKIVVEVTEKGELAVKVVIEED